MIENKNNYNFNISLTAGITTIGTVLGLPTNVLKIYSKSFWRDFVSSPSSERCVGTSCLLNSIRDKSVNR